MESPNMNIGPDFAAERKFVSKCGFAFLIYCVLYVVVQTLSVGVATVYAPELFDSSYTYYGVLLLPAYALALSGCLLFCKYLPTTPIPKNKLRFSRYCAFFSVCFVCLFVGTLIGNNVGMLMDSLFGGDAYSVDNLIAETDTGATLLFLVLVAPAAEELVFRKLLCDRLARYGELGTILMSGLLFGLYHGNFYQFFYATLLGMLFAFVYLRTGKIWVTMSLHALVNLYGGVFSGSVTKLLGNDLNEFLESVYAGSFTPEMLNDLIAKLPQLALLGVYEMVYFGLVAAGIAVLIINRKKITFRDGPVNLGENRFSVMWVNGGIILFCIAAAAVFARQLVL